MVSLRMPKRSLVSSSLLLTTLLLVLPASPEPTLSFIVQGPDLAVARTAVSEVGGVVTHELGIIDAVGVRLSPSQLGHLQGDPSLRLWADRRVASDSTYTSVGTTDSASSSNDPDSFYPTLVGASSLHAAGITGRGITVAFVDSGYLMTDGTFRAADGHERILAAYDARAHVLTDPINGIKKGQSDLYGHGSHVSSVALSSRVSGTGLRNGVAPDADLVMVSALDATGSGSYLDVIRGLDWLLANASTYGIRVVNLSLSAKPVSHYWDDPLNQAVMRLWDAGLVVVASAGNTGPDALSITVPGNNPYVITVGAISDAYTPLLTGDDFVTSFSAAGPTYEGFVKPELVAPGGHVLGLMWPQSAIATAHPEYQQEREYFVMSGTSQAAAVVSGVAALLLQLEPTLSPDDLKCRLLATARPALGKDGAAAYSVFQQGAGLVDAAAASRSTAARCANYKLEVRKDLAGIKHYGGPANMDEDGNFYIVDSSDDGTWWSGAYVGNDAYLWSNSSLNASSYLWSNNTAYSSGYLWSNTGDTGYVFSAGLSEPVSANLWVEQQ